MTLTRFVYVGSLGQVPVGEDVLVVEPGVPERRVLRRLWTNVGRRRDLVERLAGLVGVAAAPRVLEIGGDAENRVCVIFEDTARMPWELARPRSRAEAALVARDALRALLDVVRAVDYVRDTLLIGHLSLDLHGVVGVRSLWPPQLPPDLTPATIYGGFAGVPALVADVEELARGLGLPIAPRLAGAERTLPQLDEELRAASPPVRPARWSPPLIGDARRLLDVLTDADHKEAERVDAAYRLSCVPALATETVALLVRALNEPLRSLPFVAQSLLADRLVPVALCVDASTGLLRRCRHEWASTEIVKELGGAGVERWCPDCDARVTLPQTIEAFAGRSAVADAFAAGKR